MTSAAADFDWNHVRAFLAAAEEGSLSAAARILRQSQPTIGRQVAALEADLGVTLFERVGRSLQLTEAGAELLNHVRSMGDAARRVSLVASGQSQAVEGRVRITASDVFAATILPPIVARIRNEAPGIVVEVVSTNDLRNLQRREADIAVRHVRSTQPDLIARLIGEFTASLYAAPSLIQRMGQPSDLADLARFPFVGFGEDHRLVEELEKYGVPITLGNILVTSNEGNASWALARQGLGVCIMSDAVAAMTADVVPVLPTFGPIRFPVWLAVHRELRTSRRIRLVFDILAEELQSRVAEG